MNMKENYEKKLQAQLDEWNAEIARFRAKAEQAQADAQLKYYREIEELESMQEEARRKLAELRTAGDNAWEDVKAGTESVWDTYRAAWKSAMSRFK